MISWVILSAMSWVFSGSKNRALFGPAISGIDDTFEAITGVPHFIASSTGRPNPSYKDGKTYAVARLYRAMSSGSGTRPAKMTFSWRPSSAVAFSASG